MDRFYSPNHEPDDPWFRVGTLDVNTTVLVTGLSVLVMVLYVINHEFLYKLQLDDGLQSPFWQGRVVHGQVWRVITWPIANTVSIWTVLTAVIFYLFGKELERALGRGRFVWFLGSITVVIGVVGCLVKVDPGGLFLLESAVFAAFIVANPTAMSFFNIPLWIFGVVFLAIDLLQYTGDRAWGLVILTLVSVGIAMLEARAFGLSEPVWIPRLPLPGSGQRPPQQQHRRRTKRSRRSGTATVTPIRKSPTSADLLRQAEVDILLEKINEHGIKSLTPEERRRLDEHSRRMRDERP